MSTILQPTEVATQSTTALQETNIALQAREHGSDSDEIQRELPPPPNPSNDPKLLDKHELKGELNGKDLGPQGNIIFNISPLEALELLGASIEALVLETGDVPPTPPPRSPTLPNMRGMEAEKQTLVRSQSEKNLARLRSGSITSLRGGKSPRKAVMGTPNSKRQADAQSTPTRPPGRGETIDGVQLRPAPQDDTQGPKPESGASAEPSKSEKACETPHKSRQVPAEPYVVIGANSQPLNLQHSAITRKFYSKQPPPIPISDYLKRIHKFCPMSTAVYLATSLYIHRLAVTEGAIAVTARNAHRLLLAGLRVAMKALEDVSFPHGKVAKVGGVSEAELARLEISFCFLTSFELMVTAEALRDHWEMLKEGEAD